jgi:hypothetical protein
VRPASTGDVDGRSVASQIAAAAESEPPAAPATDGDGQPQDAAVEEPAVSTEAAAQEELAAPPAEEGEPSEVEPSAEMPPEQLPEDAPHQTSVEEQPS